MFALLFLVSTLDAKTVADHGWHRYVVTVNAELTRMDVRACFADGLPDRLIADHALAREATREFRLLRAGERVSAAPRSNAILLQQPSDDGCIEWTTDLARIVAAERMNIGYRTGDTLLLAPGTWFWRPPVLTRNRDIEIRFDLPPGVNVSVPWHLLEAPANADVPVRIPFADDPANTWRFRYRHAPLDWPALMAIGDLQRTTFDITGTPFRLAVSSGPAHVDIDAVNDWLQPAAHAVATLWGEFPSRHVQLLVVPVGEGYDAAPWAQAHRGGGDAVHFFMNARATPAMLREDWIATHELAHLALPFVRRGDAWLSEGFASYYQNVLRARAGMLSEEAAWQALHDGFMRGHRDTEYDTLEDDTRAMYSRGRVMRVYWSGAAIALLADVELRRRTGNVWSLDRVLQEFNACCREPERTWSARELFARFDAIAGTTLFDTLYRNNVYSRHFPRIDETLAALGVKVRDDRVTLDDDATAAAIRAAILRGEEEQATPGASAGRAGD